MALDHPDISPALKSPNVITFLGLPAELEIVLLDRPPIVPAGTSVGHRCSELREEPKSRVLYRPHKLSLGRQLTLKTFLDAKPRFSVRHEIARE